MSKEQAMGKDLSDQARYFLDRDLGRWIDGVAAVLWDNGHSLALAREHLINILPAAFDRAAEELNGDANG